MICVRCRQRAHFEGESLAHILVQGRLHVDLVRLDGKVGVAAEVAADDEAGEHLVDDRVAVVLDDAEHVEPGQDRFGELDVLRKGCRRGQRTRRH